MAQNLGQAEFFHPESQGGRMELEHGGCTVGSLDTPSGGFESPKDMVPLSLVRNGANIEPIKKILPEPACGNSSCNLRLVAAMTRTLTLIVPEPPTRSNSPSWRTRSSFACVPSGNSPTSSSRIVPPSASSNRPLRWRSAPVKAPLSWPNSSLSTSASGKVAQFIVTYGLLERELFSWIARAISSLPTPVSPCNRTVASPFGHLLHTREHVF